MTQLLEEALAKVRNLPAEDQDAIATLILSELEDERQWDEAFGRSQELLKQLADQARARPRGSGSVRMPSTIDC